MPKGRNRHALSRFFTITSEKANSKDFYCYCNECFKDAVKTMEEKDAYEAVKFRNSKQNCEHHLEK